MVTLRPRLAALPLPLAIALAACGPRTQCPCDASAPADAADPAPALVVDDFEDGDGRALAGAYWYVYDDQDNGGGSSIEVPRSAGALTMDGEGFESARSLRASYRLERGTLTYPPYVGVGVGLDAAHRDLRDYGALEYSYKGGAHQVRIETANVEAYDFHAVTLPASPTWRTVTLEFSLFQQGGWGPKVPLALDQSTAIGWQVRGDSGDAGEFLIDGVRLLPSGAREDQAPTLELHDPEPPALAKLDALAIDHPLQARAMAALDRGYNITNWLEQDDFDGDAPYYDEAFVARLAAAGFAGLRLPVDLDRYVETRHTGRAGELSVELDPQLLAVLDDFDAWTRAHGLSLTIDYHQYDGSYDVDDPASTREMVALWAAVAEHFAPNPREDLFYELLNEPELAAGERGPTAAEWTALSSQMIAAIREHDPARPILFGDVKWYGIDELVAREPFADANIIYVFHFYEPFIFTHQGAPWAGLGSTHDIPYPYAKDRWTRHREELGFSELNEPWQLDLLARYHREGNRAALRNRLVEVKRWAVEHQVPIICNEFGVHDASSRHADRVRYYGDLIGLFEELEIPWQIWFQLMDAETGAIDPGYAAALGL